MNHRVEAERDLHECLRRYKVRLDKCALAAELSYLKFRFDSRFGLLTRAQFKTNSMFISKGRSKNLANCAAARDLKYKNAEHKRGEVSSDIWYCFVFAGILNYREISFPVTAVTGSRTNCDTSISSVILGLEIRTWKMFWPPMPVLVFVTAPFICITPVQIAQYRQS